MENAPMLVFEANAPVEAPVAEPLVRRLFHRLPDAGVVAPPATVPAVVPAAAPPLIPAAVPAAPPIAPPVPSWEVVLRRCREVTKADCVFAVDGSGLVVGRQGTYGRAEVDRVAAHVSRAFDLLDSLQEIGSESESICTRYAEGRWLTAVRIRPDDDRIVTIGVIGPFTMITQDRQRLRNTFLRMFTDERTNEAA